MNITYIHRFRVLMNIFWNKFINTDVFITTDECTLVSCSDRKNDFPLFWSCEVLYEGKVGIYFKAVSVNQSIVSYVLSPKENIVSYMNKKHCY
jgi:hypothetical protein